MSITTTEAITSSVDDVMVAGVVTTTPVLTRSLPDHVPHVSFHIDTPHGPGLNVHVDGDLAERAQLAVHRRNQITVGVKRVYRRNPNQITPDVDASSFEIHTN